MRVLDSRLGLDPFLPADSTPALLGRRGHSASVITRAPVTHSEDRRQRGGLPQKKHIIRSLPPPTWQRGLRRLGCNSAAAAHFSSEGRTEFPHPHPPDARRRAHPRCRRHVASEPSTRESTRESTSSWTPRWRSGVVRRSKSWLWWSRRDFSLRVCSPSEEGLLRQRLVKLDVLMDGALTGDQERLEERQHVIHARVLPPGSRMRVQRLHKGCSDAWHACRRRREA